MADRTLLIQYTVNQRKERPAGLRVWSDGVLQRPAEDNPPPTEAERLDVDREIRWTDIRTLTVDQVTAIQVAILSIGFFDLPARLLINYCKEDPGTAIWTAYVEGRCGRVVVFDPRPKRSPELDTFSAQLNEIIAR
jgi:hypothetical protein